jgi:hypothetical protein
MLKKINIKIVLLFAFIIAFIIFGIYFFNNTDRKNCIRYIKAEGKIDVKLNNLLSSEDKIEKAYYANKLSRGKAVQGIKKVANDLEKLYDNFKWTKGNIYIKELYATKKEIIIDYAELYMNRVSSISQGIKPTDTDDTTYITALVARYNSLDKALRSIYKINFAS